VRNDCIICERERERERERVRERDTHSVLDTQHLLIEGYIHTSTPYLAPPRHLPFHRLNLLLHGAHGERVMVLPGDELDLDQLNLSHDGSSPPSASLIAA
jgi:hypothetical protein